ncbi:Uncharacterized protein HZ326_19492 [Fusarium oxysporum f. sp. albedinis]|nr:Uncharacterized protein HZ326_19492 [Fusarium oxysporum f. sp. albedinis]
MLVFNFFSIEYLTKTQDWKDFFYKILSRFSWLDPLDFTIGWICALETEYVAARVFLDEEYPVSGSLPRTDPNKYTFG